ncbi:MAG: DUF433 domain-containing protein [Candidatus Korarchaeota archaeon]|nr:DUF433 domain-containing protein [Candidatus Korarchaeota archaeon]
MLGDSARIEGTRIAVWMIVALIKSGLTVEEVLEELSRARFMGVQRIAVG